MNERRVRVGVIGAGLFAEQCHIPGVQAHPHGEVVALCARDQTRLAALAARTGVPHIHGDYLDLIARADIDAVTVVTPDAQHYEVVMAALRAGKHVLCEKPLAMTVEQAREMTALADSAGLVAMVAFTFRYSRALMALRRLLREGAIGLPFHVAMQVHWGGLIAEQGALEWRDQAALSAGGIWGDGGSHLFDALAYALAPAEEVCAQMMVVPRDDGALQPDSPDLAMCLARTRLIEGNTGALSGYADRERGAVHVSLLTSRVDQPRAGSDTIEVVGTHGAIAITLTRGIHERASIRRAGDQDWQEVDLGPDAYTDQPLALTRMMAAFIDAVRRGHLDAEQDPGFGAGLHTQCALEAGVRSAHSRCWERL